MVFSHLVRHSINLGVLMDNNKNLEFLKREGRINSFPELEYEQKDDSKIRLLVLGLLLCILVALWCRP